MRGFTEALRLELARSGVVVCSVHPGGIRTNIVRNARIHRGMDGSAEDPALMIARFEKIARTSPAIAAKVIADGMARREPRILIGQDARMLDRLQRVFPRNYGQVLRTMGKIFDR